MKKKRQGSTLIYLLSFFVVFLVLCAFSVDATITFAMRAKLQNAAEAIALSAASGFNYTMTSTSAEIEKEAQNAFEMWKYGPLEVCDLSVEVDIDKKEVLVALNMPSPTFFLSFLGVSAIQLEAVSCAKSEELNVTSSYPGVNWVSAASSYLSDIISKQGNFNDTAILQPLGGGASASLDNDVTGLPLFNLIDSLDGKPLSLGAGGYVTIKLPAPIVDKPGYDLLVNEIGDAKEGYFVFAGLDVNPQKPYVSYDNVGDGLRWVNITCTGKSKESDSSFHPYTIATQTLGAQEKFYGSAYFDIGATCSGGFEGVSMAKYIRIIDDNDESAFVKNSSIYFPVMLYGESSTPTAGADIDSVSIFNHVKLISPKAFGA